MRQDPIPAAVADRLSTAARRLRAARRTALDRVAVDDREWEYAGRLWSWPAGEARTYFHELAPGEREVLEELTADLDDLCEAGGPDSQGSESRARVVGFGTGRVAVEIPGSIRGAAGTNGERAEPTPGGSDVSGNGSDVTGNGSDVTGNGSDVTGNGSDVTGNGSDVADPEPETTAGGRLVAKLARYGPSAEMGDGRPQNRRERQIWSTVESYPFLPVLGGDADGDWVVMPRADVPPDESVREEALERVRAALAPHRDRFHFDELKPENVGSYRGRYWIVDYGRPAGEPLFVEPPSESAPAESGASDGKPTDTSGNVPEKAESVDTNPAENRQGRSSEN
jgi:hypothetical protein